MPTHRLGRVQACPVAAPSPRAAMSGARDTYHGPFTVENTTKCMRVATCNNAQTHVARCVALPVDPLALIHLDERHRRRQTETTSLPNLKKELNGIWNRGLGLGLQLPVAAKECPAAAMVGGGWRVETMGAPLARWWRTAGGRGWRRGRVAGVVRKGGTVWWGRLAGGAARTPDCLGRAG